MRGITKQGICGSDKAAVPGGNPVGPRHLGGWRARCARGDGHSVAARTGAGGRLAVTLLILLTLLAVPDVVRGDVLIRAAKDPVPVDVHVGSVREIIAGSPQDRRALASHAASKLVAVVDSYPRRVVALRLRDVPINFASLSASDQHWLEERWGEDSADFYESAVAKLLGELLDRVAAERRRAAIGVAGLPVEPGLLSLEEARRTNERYRAVIAELHPFVSLRWFLHGFHSEV